VLIPLLNSKGKYCLLDSQEIIYLQTNGAGELSIYSYDEEFKIISMVKDWSNLLHNAGFMRLDRGTVVNIMNIKSFDSLINVITIRLSSGEVLIPVSQKMLRELKAQIKSSNH
jgi:DNA-binding LytR/AlgR family response regulator